MTHDNLQLTPAAKPRWGVPGHVFIFQSRGRVGPIVRFATTLHFKLTRATRHTAQCL